MADIHIPDDLLTKIKDKVVLITGPSRILPAHNNLSNHPRRLIWHRQSHSPTMSKSRRARRHRRPKTTAT